MKNRDLIRDAMMFAVKDITGRVLREDTVQSMIDDFEKQLTIPVVVRTLVCVYDAIPNLTKDKEYTMLVETNRHYNLIDDNGNDVLIGKSYMRELKKAN